MKFLRNSLLLILIAFIGIASLQSFASENFIHHSGFHLCPMSSSSDANCPPVDDSKFFIAGHVSETRFALQILSKMNPIAAQLFIAAIFLLLFLAIPQPKISPSLTYKINQSFLRWIALHNKCDIAL